MFFLLWIAPTGLHAQLPTPGAQPVPAVEDPLASKQQIARDRMTQLEDRMYRLVDKLRETEPQQAQRMEEALKQARELLIRHDMEQAIELLQQGDLASAGEQQTAVLKNLELLLKTLTQEPDQLEQIKRDMERLREFQKQVDALQQRQRDLQRRTAQAADTQPAAATQPASTAPADDEALSPAQRKLRREAAELARKMSGKADEAQDSSPEGAQGRQNQPGQPSEPGQQNQPGQQGQQGSQDQQSPPGESGENAEQTPGVQNVQQAGEHMQSAAEQIDREQNQDATEEQQKAIDELEQAKRELQENLDQLRREQQEELLRGLEARFKAMLARQTAVNESTAVLDAKGQSQWIRNDELQLAGNVQEETALVTEADQALNILREDGTTIVFPQIVEQIRGDMQSVADQLKARDTGAGTQATERQIVATLEELIAAVKQMREDLQAGASTEGEQQRQGAAAPLLPDSAELKLLRSCQLRVNDQTQRAEKAITEADSDGAAQRAAKVQLQRVADRQKELADMARKISERTTGQ